MHEIRQNYYYIKLGQNKMNDSFIEKNSYCLVSILYKFILNSSKIEVWIYKIYLKEAN